MSKFCISLHHIGEMDEPVMEGLGDADSLAGLILDINGKMPIIGQKIVLTPFSFTVLSVSPKRIERIKVRIE